MNLEVSTQETGGRKQEMPLRSSVSGIPSSVINNMKRLFDCFVSLFPLGIWGFPMLIIALLVKATSRGPVLYWPDRVGKGNTIFKMPKFRTMKINTPGSGYSSPYQSRPIPDSCREVPAQIES